MENLAKLTDYITKPITEARESEADQFSKMIGCQYGQLNVEQRQFFKIKVQQCFLEALQYTSEAAAATWRM